MSRSLGVKKKKCESEVIVSARAISFSNFFVSAI